MFGSTETPFATHADAVAWLHEHEGREKGLGTMPRRLENRLRELRREVLALDEELERFGETVTHRHVSAGNSMSKSALPERALVLWVAIGERNGRPAYIRHPSPIYTGSALWPLWRACMCLQLEPEEQPWFVHLTLTGEDLALPWSYTEIIYRPVADPDDVASAARRRECRVVVHLGLYRPSEREWRRITPEINQVPATETDVSPDTGRFEHRPIPMVEGGYSGRRAALLAALRRVGGPPPPPIPKRFWQDLMDAINAEMGLGARRYATTGAVRMEYDRHLRGALSLTCERSQVLGRSSSAR